MKARSILWIGLVGLVGLSSCTDERIISQSTTINAIRVSGEDFTDGDALTRAEYTVDGTGFHFSWTEGDTVGIYPVGGDQVAFPISSGQGSQTAQFDGGAWALRSTYSYVAYYPFSSDNYKAKETLIPVSYIGQVQNGNGSLDCLDRFDYQTSMATRPDADGNVNIALKHLGCFVRFQLKMPTVDTYSSVTLKSSKTPFVTSGTVDLTSDSIHITPVTTSQTLSIALNNVSTTSNDSVLVIYAMLAPADMSDSRIIINIQSSENRTYIMNVDGKLLKAGKAYSFNTSITPLDYQLALEREALVEIYNDLDGDNWTDGYNNNWLSDKPVCEWFGVGVDENGYVTNLYLTATGEIPSAILNLSHLKSLQINYYLGDVNREFPAYILSLSQLEYLQLSGPHLIGTIPSDIGSLSNLKHLEISDTKMGGPIPESIGQLTQLEYLDFQWNQLSGELPESIGLLKKLRHFMMRRNELSGNIPLSVQQLPIWKYDWGRIIDQNHFNEKSLIIPTPVINGTTLDGGAYSYNSQTEGYHVLIQWSAHYDDYLVSQINALNQIYTKYNSAVSFVGLISSSREESKESVETYISDNGITWPNIYWTHENNVIEGQELDFDGISRHEYAAPCFPAIFVFHNGKVVYWDLDVYGGVSSLDDYLSINVLGETPNYYISTDYSKDGQVTTKKTASVGNGINLILMGDAFSDRQIADGTYAGVLDRIVDSFFSVEPYSSFREFFNIYYINVVSATEGYDHDGQALNTFFGSGTFVGGNNSKCIEYALKAISEQYMDDALIIVAMNKDTYAGTCHMTTAPSGDYGRGLSIAYFPTSNDVTTFNGMVFHEASGHGFAKLADEYAYDYMGSIPTDVIASTKVNEVYGWWKNVDFTNNTAQVKWSAFISDSRYANENIGCYEGGLTYWSGVWRPTENSIMRNNSGGFNAPSRYAIWYRINKLAYGDSWNGTYEDFVEYDAINRTPSAVTRRTQARRNYVEKPLPALAPPVVVGHSWREELNGK